MAADTAATNIPGLLLEVACSGLSSSGSAYYVIFKHGSPLFISSRQDRFLNTNCWGCGGLEAEEGAFLGRIHCGPQDLLFVETFGCSLVSCVHALLNSAGIVYQKVKALYFKIPGFWLKLSSPDVFSFTENCGSEECSF